MSWKKYFAFEIDITVGGDTHRLEVPNRDQILIGRAPECDLVLDYPFISRQHARLSWNNQDWLIEDLGSRNGLVLKGNRVQKWVLGRPKEIGDSVSTQVKIDTLVLTFHLRLLSDNKNESQNSLDSSNVSIKVSEETKPVISSTETLTREAVSKTLNLVPGKIIESEIPKNTPNKSKAIPVLAASSEASVPKPPSSEKPKSIPSSHGSSENREAIGFDQIHPQLASSKYRRLEASVIWRGLLYDVKEFDSQEKITVGASDFASLQIPTAGRGWALANVSFKESLCWVPNGKSFSILRDGTSYDGTVLAKNGQISAKGQGHSFRVTHQDVLSVNIDSNTKVVLRYIPAQGKLAKKKPIDLDHGFRQAFLGSLIVHGVLALALILAAPRMSKGPKLKNVPERYARLLVEPPKPILPVPEPPPTTMAPPTTVPKVADVPKPKPPEPKKVVKVEKPKPKKFELPKKLEVQNRTQPKDVAPVRPVQVTEAPKPEVKVESLGALAALGAMAPNSAAPPGPNVQNLKFDKSQSVGLAAGPSVSGVSGALKAQGGKLMAGGAGGSVRTGGSSVGSGVAYGTQGLSSGTGKRNIAGAIVGTPKLAAESKLEGLTRQQVMTVVQKHAGDIQHCYEKSLLTNPGLAGRMEFEWDITAAGKVTSVRVKRSTVQNGDALGECVKGVFTSMQFPKATNGQSTTPTIGFPFGRM